RPSSGPGAVPVGGRGHATGRCPGGGRVAALGRGAGRARGRSRERRGGAGPRARIHGGVAGPAHSPHGDRRSRRHRDSPVALRRPRMSAAGWEPFEVEADVGVHGWGPTRADAFAQVTLGVCALLVSPEQLDPRERREVRAQAESPESLLVAWIDECLYV